MGHLNVARRAVGVCCRCCCRRRYVNVVVTVIATLKVRSDMHMVRLAYAQRLIPTAPDVIKTFNKYGTSTNSPLTPNSSIVVSVVRRCRYVCRLVII